MYVKLSAYSTSHELSFDIGSPFQDHVDRFLEYEKYCFHCGFTLYAEAEDEDGELDETDDKIASVCATMFDEDKMLNDGWAIEEIADMIDTDTAHAMGHLSVSKFFKEELDWDKALRPLFDAYIDKVYVYPKYRKQGFGKYIFDNLCSLFEHCFNVTMHCFVIYPTPQYPEFDEENKLEKWENLVDNKVQMKKLMISVLRKAGYRKLGNSGFYVLNCAKEGKTCGV